MKYESLKSLKNAYKTFFHCQILSMIYSHKTKCCSSSLTDLIYDINCTSCKVLSCYPAFSKSEVDLSIANITYVHFVESMFFCKISTDSLTTQLSEKVDIQIILLVSLLHIPLQSRDASLNFFS